MTAPLFPSSSTSHQEDLKARLNEFINEWHEDAAHSRIAYFEKMAPDGIYIGTDKSERWNREQFRNWAAEYFAKPCAWAFTPLHRNIYLAEGAGLAWFDEQLSSGMGVLQASGVLRIEGKLLKILHYQLSFTVPNALIDEVTKLIQRAQPQSDA